MNVEFVAYGIPMPKGSYTKMANGHVINGRRGPAAKAYKAWVEAVRLAAASRRAKSDPIDGPLNLCAVFYFPRPKHETRAERLRTHKTSSPDLSKLIRAIEDPMNDDGKKGSGLIVDDSRFVSFNGSDKRYVPYGDLSSRPRVEVTITRLAETA